MEDAYIACGITLQDKLPLCNPFLNAVSAIVPDSRGHSVTLTYLQKLPVLVPNVFDGEEEEKYEMEIRNFQMDNNLPKYEEGSRINHWWGREDAKRESKRGSQTTTHGRKQN